MIESKLKIGDKVLDMETGEIGTIKQIDDKCSKKYDKSYANPGHLEYYVNWPNGAWTRHYVGVIDNPIDSDKFMAATRAAMILFGRKNKKRAKPKRLRGE